MTVPRAEGVQSLNVRKVVPKTGGRSGSSLRPLHLSPEKANTKRGNQVGKPGTHNPSTLKKNRA